MLQVLKEDTSTKYFIDCKSKGVYNSKLVPLYTVLFLFVFFFFLHNIKSFGHKIGIKFNKRVLVVEQNYKSILVVEQNNCATKVVNGASTWCILHGDCDKISYKSKYVYSGYGIGSDGAGSWSFSNDFDWNVLFFSVDNNSSSHIDIHKNNFLVLGGGPTNDLNVSVGAAKKWFNINFSKVKKKVCLTMVFCFLMEKKYIILKLVIKVSTFQLNFV